jgi:type I restriction enzyme M protein
VGDAKLAALTTRLASLFADQISAAQAFMAEDAHAPLRALASERERAVAAEAALDKAGIKLSAADMKILLRAVSERSESAPPVIAKVHKSGKLKPDPLHGIYSGEIDGKPAIVEYEPDPDLRDTEQIPLREVGGIEAFIRREVLPYTPDAWIKEGATKIGYEVSFTRHFYKPQPLRSLDAISADILAIEKEAEGLLDGLLKGGTK